MGTSGTQIPGAEEVSAAAAGSGHGIGTRGGTRTGIPELPPVPMGGQVTG